MKRVVAIVDGLNLFHALEDLEPGIEFVDLRRLVERLVKRPAEQLISIRYFSALPSHLDGPTFAAREVYLENLKGSGIDVVFGRFSKRRLQCPKCHQTFSTMHEKETDVAVATALLKVAYENQADSVLLFSTDTDLLPAIILAREIHVDLGITLISTAKNLRASYARTVNHVSGQIRLSTDLLRHYQFEH